MGNDEHGERPAVQCRCGPLTAKGTYEVHGRFLVLESPFGTVRTALGLQNPRRLAARLLKNRCCQEAAALPKPEILDVMEGAESLAAAPAIAPEP